MTGTSLTEWCLAAATVALLLYVFGRGDLSKILNDAAEGIRNFRDRL